MTKSDLKSYHNRLYVEYRNQMHIVFEDLPEDDFGSYLESRYVVLPECIKKKPSEWSLFAFLHEIGHILTNNTNQYRCVQEFLATQWAINKAKEIGFNVPNEYINSYQKYIYDWRKLCAKRKGIRLPTEIELTLQP